MPAAPALQRSAPALLAILAVSGACSLAYQSTWLRELRLIFGASTPATSAVLCMFMGGLGLGGLLLGRRAERTRRPLRFYAKIELCVAAVAALSPLTLYLGRALYLAIGGQAALGVFGATLLRLLVAAVIVGVPAFFMGGTLPAAARAFRGDEGRRFVGALYGVNTLGAVLGAFVPTFFLFESLGQRRTLWLFCALNVVIGAAALWLSLPETHDDAPASDVPEETKERPERIEPLILAAAFVTGFVFFFAELVWYRLGAPLLGGSTYTFAFILSLALLGIGAGGAWFSRVPRPPSWGRFASSCAVAAVALAAPLWFGDDLARFAEVARGLETNGFWGLVLGWGLVASILVLPLSLVAGYQFPLLLALARGGRRQVAADVGAVYGANTVGAIVGSLAGGFGLLPVLGAVAAWRAAVLLLMALAVVAALRATGRARVVVAIALAGAVWTLSAGEGPGALWRHGAVGAGRAVPPASRVVDLQRRARAELRTVNARDGREAATAVILGTGPGFSVNGKIDGNAVGDSITQVGSAILPAVVHGDVRQVFVVGLGTGQTAGWLGRLEGVERVRVAELEPDIVEFARLVGRSNLDVVDNPKVDIAIGDGRELLLTSGERFDLIISEPSNPYRAGVAGFYTREFYEAAQAHLADDGIFVQWVQGYEVEPAAVALVMATLRSVFDEVTLWHVEAGDLLLLARSEKRTLPTRAEVERRLADPLVAKAFRRAMGLPATFDAYQSRLVAYPDFVDGVAARLPGWLNTDDRAVLEFSFARTVGRSELSAIGSVLRVAAAHPGAPPRTPYRHRSFTHRNTAGPALHPDPEMNMMNASRVADFDSAREIARGLEPDPSDESLLFRTAALLASSSVDEDVALSRARRDQLLQLGEPVGAATLDLIHAHHHDEPAVLPSALVLIGSLQTTPWGPVDEAGRALRRLAYGWRPPDADAHQVARALAKGPFAAHVLELDRVLVGRELAARGDPDRSCIQLEAELEGQLPWEESAWAARERCYLAHAPSLASSATEELRRVRDAAPATFFTYAPNAEINPVTNASE